jgi:hypothetical protein
MRTESEDRHGLIHGGPHAGPRSSMGPPMHPFPPAYACPWIPVWPSMDAPMELHDHTLATPHAPVCMTSRSRMHAHAPTHAMTRAPVCGCIRPPMQHLTGWHPSRGLSYGAPNARPSPARDARTVLLMPPHAPGEPGSHRRDAAISCHKAPRHHGHGVRHRGASLRSRRPPGARRVLRRRQRLPGLHPVRTPRALRTWTRTQGCRRGCTDWRRSGR